MLWVSAVALGKGAENDDRVGDLGRAVEEVAVSAAAQMFCVGAGADPPLDAVPDVSDAYLGTRAPRTMS